LKFVNGSIQNIRSLSQRGLAVAWARLARLGLPAFDRFAPEAQVHDPKQLVVWKVEGVAGQFVFRALYRGRLVGEAFNDDWTGKTLSEVTPASLRLPIIGASDQCALTGCAVYTILRANDEAGHPIDLERLLLPFGKHGRVQIIVASLQLISAQGAVERREMFKKFEAKSETKLSVTISAASFSEDYSKPLTIDYTAAQKEVTALNRAGNLQDAAVNRFSVRRDYALVIAALSFMTKVNIKTIEPLLGEGRLDELVVACKASGLSWPTTTMIIRNRPRCRPASKRELAQSLYMFEALSLSVAQQTLRLWPG
jgi:hypothetical protein